MKPFKVPRVRGHRTIMKGLIVSLVFFSRVECFLGAKMLVDELIVLDETWVSTETVMLCVARRTQQQTTAPQRQLEKPRTGSRIQVQTPRPTHFFGALLVVFTDKPALVWSGAADAAAASAGGLQNQERCL